MNSESQMSKSDIYRLAKPILDSQISEIKSWKNSDHAKLIANIAVECGLPSTTKNKFLEALTIPGQGVVNSSQFQKWMAKEKGIEFNTKQKANIFAGFEA
jgi:hypothetical protein